MVTKFPRIWWPKGIENLSNQRYMPARLNISHWMAHYCWVTIYNSPFVQVIGCWPQTRPIDLFNINISKEPFIITIISCYLKFLQYIRNENMLNKYFKFNLLLPRKVQLVPDANLLKVIQALFIMLWHQVVFISIIYINNSQSL